MEHRWYAPDEPWPEHAKPWWSTALREARAAGWHLRTFSGHTWGKLVCDRDAPDPHEMLIFSTGRGGENAARQLQKVVRRCQHTRDRTPPDGIARAGRLLDGASTLLNAVELLLSATDKRAQAEELLSLAEQSLAHVEDSDALLDAATELDSEAAGDRRRAAELTSSARYSPKRPLTEDAVTDEAEHRVDQAEDITAARDIAQRVRVLRERITGIRSRL